MLRYKTRTRPGLVALYDIRPGNRAGLFLQPRSLHGASHQQTKTTNAVLIITDKFNISTTAVHYLTTVLLPHGTCLII